MSNDNEETTSSHTSPFEAIRRVNEEGIEYWTARDLARVLGYATNYRNFKNAISKAEIACLNSGQSVTDHFAHVRNMVDIGSGAKRKVEDVQISRYGCYLIIQNADPTDELIANLFRASQTRQKLEREQVKGKEQANRTHYEVGQRVRQTIKDLGGTLPENLPSPKESIQQLEQKERKRLKQGLQPSMFDEPTEPEN